MAVHSDIAQPAFVLWAGGRHPGSALQPHGLAWGRARIGPHIVPQVAQRAQLDFLAARPGSWQPSRPIFVLFVVVTGTRPRSGCRHDLEILASRVSSAQVWCHTSHRTVFFSGIRASAGLGLDSESLENGSKDRGGRGTEESRPRPPRNGNVSTHVGVTRDG